MAASSGAPAPGAALRWPTRGSSGPVGALRPRADPAVGGAGREGRPGRV